MGCLLVFIMMILLFFIMYLFTISPIIGLLSLAGLIALVIRSQKKDAEKRSKASQGINGEIQKRFDDLTKIHKFNPTQKYISPDNKMVLAIDEDSKKLSIISVTEEKTQKPPEISWTSVLDIYDYKDILETQIVEDGVSINSTSRSSQLGGALLGGIVAGEVGAVIGGLSGSTSSAVAVYKIDLKIVVNNTQKPFHLINFLIGNEDIDGSRFPIKKQSDRYKNAFQLVNHWHDLISILIRRADQEDKMQELNITNSVSVADEIRKLSELLKDGIITDEEFNIQKKNLLLK